MRPAAASPYGPRGAARDSSSLDRRGRQREAVVRTFLVECYMPGVDESAVAEAGRRVRSAVERMRRHGEALAYAGATLVPADEVVFHAFTATDSVAVEQASRVAGLPFERIVEAVSIEGGRTR